MAAKNQRKSHLCWRCDKYQELEEKICTLSALVSTSQERSDLLEKEVKDLSAKLDRVANTAVEQRLQSQSNTGELEMHDEEIKELRTLFNENREVVAVKKV